MKVKIKDNLEGYAISSDEYFLDEYELEDIAEKISGKTLEVDTEYLFKNEFNLKPIPKISNYTIRIFIEDVDEIIDDEREGKAYCELCNETSNSTEVCTHCGRSDYLEPLVDDDYY